MNDMDDREQLINQVIKTFNFERVHITMKALDWQWLTTEGNGHAVPSIAKLKATAKILLREAINHKVVCSGGFVARYHPAVDDEPEMFSLKFVVAGMDSLGDQVID